MHHPLEAPVAISFVTYTSKYKARRVMLPLSICLLFHFLWWYKMKFSPLLSLAAAALVQAGTVVWDGSFEPFNTPDDFAKWSWANQVGTYQYVRSYLSFRLQNTSN